MPPLAGQTVLDLACGTGRYGLMAQERGARGVISIDNSAAMLAGNPLRERVQATTRSNSAGWRIDGRDVVRAGVGTSAALAAVAGRDRARA